MDLPNCELTERAIFTDERGEHTPERVATFEQLQDEESDLALTEAIATICGITEAEFRIYLTVLDHPHSTIADIAEILGRDQSTIGKQLNPLHEQELVTRYPRNLSNGGVKYRYVAQPLADTTEWLQHELDTWTDTVTAQLSRLHTN